MPPRPTLESFPDEILCQVFGHLDLPDLRKLRWRSRNFYRPVQTVFRGFVQLDPRPVLLQRFMTVAQNPLLARPVHSVHIKTTHQAHRLLRTPWSAVGRRNLLLPRIFTEALLLLALFPNLDTVTLDFDDQIESPLPRYQLDPEPPEPRRIRETVLTLVIAALARRERPLRELSLRNCHDVKPCNKWIHKTKARFRHNSWGKVMMQLSSLRIDAISPVARPVTLGLAPVYGPLREKTVANRRHADDFDVFRNETLVSYLGHLGSFQDNLTSLALSVEEDMFLGWLPELITQAGMLPHLERLSLTRYGFIMDLQLSGILSHKKLKTLHLNSCTILYHTIKIPKDASVPISQTYGGRWHGYFDQIGNELPKLKTLRYGAYSFIHGYDASYDGHALSVLPKSRYLAMDHRVRSVRDRFKFQIPAEDLEIGDGRGRQTLSFAPRPRCDGEDKAA